MRTTCPKVYEAGGQVRGKCECQDGQGTHL